MPDFMNCEIADINFIYVCLNVNAIEARCLYLLNRMTSHCEFSSIHHCLAQIETFGLISINDDRRKF